MEDSAGLVSRLFTALASIMAHYPALFSVHASFLSPTLAVSPSLSTVYSAGYRLRNQTEFWLSFTLNVLGMC